MKKVTADLSIKEMEEKLGKKLVSTKTTNAVASDGTKMTITDRIYE